MLTCLYKLTTRYVRDLQLLEWIPNMQKYRHNKIAKVRQKWDSDNVHPKKYTVSRIPMWTLTVTVGQCCHLAPPAYQTFETKKFFQQCPCVLCSWLMFQEKHKLAALNGWQEWWLCFAIRGFSSQEGCDWKQSKHLSRSASVLIQATAHLSCDVPLHLDHL